MKKKYFRKRYIGTHELWCRYMGAKVESFVFECHLKGLGLVSEQLNYYGKQIHVHHFLCAKMT